MAEQDFRVQKGIVVGNGDVTVPLDHEVISGKFNTYTSAQSAAAGVTLTGTTLAADGNDSHIDINLTPKGTGEVNITKVDINAGTIDGATIATSDITVGTGKTLDVSGGSLTLANDQISGDKVEGGTIASTTISTLAGNLAFGSDGSGVDVTFHSATAGDSMLWDASEEKLVITGTNGATALNVADGNVTVSDTLTATNIGAFQASGAIDFNTQAMTNVDINSGNIDGTPIGSSNAQSGKFTSVLASTHGKIGGTALSPNTLLQINGVEISAGGNLGGGGSAATADTIKYSEVRIHSDIANDDLAGMHVENMGGVFIVDNAEEAPNTGQGSIFTVGRSNATDADSWGIGRQATTGKFHIGYANADYDNVADGTGNPMHPNQAVLMIDTSGNTTLEQNGAYLGFTGATSGGAAREVRFKASSNGITASGDETYILPVSFPSGSSKVLQSTTSGGLSWVAQSGGIGQSLSATDNQIVRMDGTDDVQGSSAVIDDSGNLTVLGTIAATNITGNQSMIVTLDTDAEFVALTLTNQSDSANTNGFVSQLFNLEDTGGNAVDAGKIAVKKEQSFTATASTQDSEMGFWTSLNGTLTEQMTIASTGYITTTSGLTLGGDITVGDDIILNSDDAVIRPVVNSGSNLAGHTLFIKGGQGTGSGASGDIIFHTKTSNGSGATGLHNMGAAMTLSGGNVTIHGDLTVSGTNTVLNTDELQVEDHVITLNYSGSDSSSSADGAGFIIQDAVDASNDASLTWNASNDDFQLSHTLDVAGSVTATGSFVIGSASMNEADLEKLDGITNGTAAANKALVVDGSKDIGTLGTVTAANFTATTALTAPSLSVDSVAVLDTSTATGTSFSGSAVVLASYPFATYRTVKFIGHIVNDSTHETDAFEILVTYDGASAPSGSAATDVHMTTYAYISSNDTPMGTFAAEKHGSNGNVELKFTNTVSNFTGSFAVTATQLIKT
jgi:hypothetical protein